MSSVSLFSTYPQRAIHNQKNFLKRQAVVQSVDSVHFSGAAQVDSPGSARKFQTILGQMLAETTTMWLQPKEYRERAARMKELAQKILKQFKQEAIVTGSAALVFKTNEGLLFLNEEESKSYLKSGQFPTSALRLNNTYFNSAAKLLLDLLTYQDLSMEYIGQGNRPVFMLSDNHLQATIPDTLPDIDYSLTQYQLAQIIAPMPDPFGIGRIEI